MADKYTPMTPEALAALAKTHETHIGSLKAECANAKDGAPLLGFAITALTGAKEAIDGHLKNVAAKAKADADAAAKAATDAAT